MKTKHRFGPGDRPQSKERKRMRKSLATLAPLVAVLALAVAACGGGGSDNGGSKSGGGAAPNTGQTGKKGGTLTVMSLADVDSLDPGYWYYQYDYMSLGLPAQRTLYSWKPQDNSPTPDLATGFPQAS